jgi:hypothetical protein
MRDGLYNYILVHAIIAFHILSEIFTYLHYCETIVTGFSGRAFSTKESCGSPARLCKTRYNTTAPMYGISLTSGQPVTIVQKFPDLLQQVVFEVCE